MDWSGSFSDGSRYEGPKIRNRMTLLYNTRERLLYAEFGMRPFRLLDVGCGNDSPAKIRAVFPACEYHGVDRDLRYGLGDESRRAMTAF